MAIKPAISSMSLGRAWHHELHHKLQQAAYHGFQGIEVFFEDLEYLARGNSSDHTTSASPDQLLGAADQIHTWCDQLHLQIICLQPFLHYDGLLDRTEHARRIEEAELWFQIAKRLHTDMVAVPATFLPASQTTGDKSVIVTDLRKLADVAARDGLRLAYEALCWSTHIQTWEGAYDIVCRVDRPNFGLCLDTFNFAGRVYADPASPTGKTPNADREMAASLARLRAIDVSKVFYVQVVDGERLAKPLVEGHEWWDKEQPARMSWSRQCRLLYGERDRGGYLPIREIMEVILQDLRYEGWVSMELFNRSMADSEQAVPTQHASRGQTAWAKLKADMRQKL